MNTTSETFPFMHTPAYEQMQSQLGDRGMELLDQQLNLWFELNGRELDSSLRDSLSKGAGRLPAGSLMHGVTVPSEEVLRGIAQYGIVSGELIGFHEDAETHGCADFFKVPEDSTVAEYINWTEETIKNGNLRTSRGEKSKLRGVTFIVDPEAEGVDGLLGHDAYTDPETQPFTHLPAGRTATTTAAILGGVPRGAIAGIILGEREVSDPVRVGLVREIFPTTPLLNRQGKLLTGVA